MRAEEIVNPGEEILPTESILGKVDIVYYNGIMLRFTSIISCFSVASPELRSPFHNAHEHFVHNSRI